MQLIAIILLAVIIITLKRNSAKIKGAAGEAKVNAGGLERELFRNREEI